jgi:hypothetical protein
VARDAVDEQHERAAVAGRAIADRVTVEADLVLGDGREAAHQKEDMRTGGDEPLYRVPPLSQKPLTCVTIRAG